jgi:hypothetical protein
VAYVREKKVRNKDTGKTYGYYQLVEGVWDSGKVRQKVITHLGRHPTVEAALKAWPKEVKRLRREGSDRTADALARKLYSLEVRTVTRIHIPSARKNGSPYIVLNERGRYTIADGYGVVYIGNRYARGGYDLPQSPWGNPYSVKDYGREEAVSMYREHVLDSEELLSRLGEIDGETLACWCKPDELCHGDVLLRLAAELRGPTPPPR